MIYFDGDIPRPPLPPPETESQQWVCGPFGLWPLAFPWGGGVSWGTSYDLPYTIPLALLTKFIPRKLKVVTFANDFI